ncbi:MAG: Fic family protein [Thermoplasmatales archaeon]|nr:MAG: Fic family protein [Thermoplasmatales archaeon]
MVSIKKKKISNKIYHYIQHTYRLNGKVHYKEKYIGEKIPNDIEKKKKEFQEEIFQEQWFSMFDKIKDNFIKNKKKMPNKIKEKELGTFAVKFTYNSNKIEGSTLTHLETALLLEKRISPANKPIEDIKEAEQHREVFYDMIKHDKNINISTLIHWHKNLFQFTKKDVAGKIRTYQVYISGSIHLPPTPIDLDRLIKEFFDWYKNKNKMHPVHLAALVHLKFVSIHPFGDGNGRITRLFMNYVLNKNGYPMSIIEYKNRISYYNALEKSNVNNDENIFTLWFFKRYLKEYENYL